MKYFLWYENSLTREVVERSAHHVAAIIAQQTEARAAIAEVEWMSARHTHSAQLLHTSLLGSPVLEPDLQTTRITLDDKTIL